MILNGALVYTKIRVGSLRLFLNLLFEKGKIGEKIETDIVNQILLHLEYDPKLTVVQLQELITLCQNQLKTPSDFKTNWFPIFSKLLSLTPDFDKLISLDEIMVPSAEFRLNLLKNLCIRNQWKGDQFPILVKMIREISNLTNAELEEIFENLIKVEMKNLEPEQIPPLVYQVLLMTQEHPSFIPKFLSLLADFYNEENQTEDSEEFLGSFSSNSLKRSESISMVHLTSEARTGHPIVKELLKMMKIGFHVPELIFNPFMLKLSLSLTSLKHYRGSIVESLKSIVGKILSANTRKFNNAWFAEEIQTLVR